jgi:hypothetical protein
MFRDKSNCYPLHNTIDSQSHSDTKYKNSIILLGPLAAFPTSSGASWNISSRAILHSSTFCFCLFRWLYPPKPRRIQRLAVFSYYNQPRQELIHFPADTNRVVACSSSHRLRRCSQSKRKAIFDNQYIPRLRLKSASFVPIPLCTTFHYHHH